jgi:hypothetical protein
VRITWLLILAIVTLGTAYYLLDGLVQEHLPWAFIPSWWWHVWPSRHSAALAWLQSLTIVGTLIAALPIVIAITLFIRRAQYAVAFSVAVCTAAVIVAGSLAEYPPWSSGRGTDLWLANLVILVAVGGSPPFLLWLGHRLPSNHRWRGP